MSENERMATKEELLNVMKEYGVKEYYTDNYELGGVPRGSILLKSVNPEFDEKFWDLIHLGDDEESGWVLVFLANNVDTYGVENYEKHIVNEE